MDPWTIRVTDLPVKAKLCEMQQNAPPIWHPNCRCLCASQCHWRWQHEQNQQNHTQGQYEKWRCAQVILDSADNQALYYAALGSQRLYTTVFLPSKSNFAVLMRSGALETKYSMKAS